MNRKARRQQQQDRSGFLEFFGIVTVIVFLIGLLSHAKP